MKTGFLILSIGAAVLILGLISVMAFGVIEQHIYISKVVSILKDVKTSTDPKLNSLRNTDGLGFTANISTVQLNGGWVVIVDRSYPSPEDAPAVREFFEHRIILFKDSDGRIYAQAQGIFPPDDVNNKGEDDFGWKVDNLTVDFKDSVKKGSKSSWDFLEINQ